MHQFAPSGWCRWFVRIQSAFAPTITDRQPILGRADDTTIHFATARQRAVVVTTIWSTAHRGVFGRFAHRRPLADRAVRLRHVRQPVREYSSRSSGGAPGWVFQRGRPKCWVGARGWNIVVDPACCPRTTSGSGRGVGRGSVVTRGSSVRPNFVRHRAPRHSWRWLQRGQLSQLQQRHQLDDHGRSVRGCPCVVCHRPLHGPPHCLASPSCAAACHPSGRNRNSGAEATRPREEVGQAVILNFARSQRRRAGVQPSASR